MAQEAQEVLVQYKEAVPLCWVLEVGVAVAGMSMGRMIAAFGAARVQRT